MLITVQVPIGNQLYEVQIDHKVIPVVGDVVVICNYADRVTDRIINYQKDFVIVKLTGNMIGSSVDVLEKAGWRKV
jgi:hypothetical protein